MVILKMTAAAPKPGRAFSMPPTVPTIRTAMAAIHAAPNSASLIFKAQPLRNVAIRSRMLPTMTRAMKLMTDNLQRFRMIGSHPASPGEH